ncbi:MAG: thioredoxin-disulfide reductase [Clostridiales Family XIII bacterium]|jgi:thioredoxin reductase (NADPH)|nr:thioredoxin-disulfide reductase [Clostridiales Family XIII bacterium]
MEKVYDIGIIGSGPAGLSAALYGARSGLSVVIFEKAIAGGQIFQSSIIENYPGGILGETGADFSMRLLSQAEHFSVEKIQGEIKSIEPKGEIKKVRLNDKEYLAKTLIIATGLRPKLLDVPGEASFLGKGVSYCATCDGPLFKNLDIYVIGGGDSAVEEAVHLAKFGKSVNIIHRRDIFRATKTLIEKAEKTDNINFLFNKTVKEIDGENFITKLILKDVKTGEEEIKIPSEGTDRLGIFIFVGIIPNAELYKNIIDNDNGYILTDENMNTSIPGVFAAGDIRNKKLRQVITATSDGAIAAVSALEYLT